MYLFDISALNEKMEKVMHKYFYRLSWLQDACGS